MVLENFTINMSNSKDNLICTTDHGIVKVINIIKLLNGKIKTEVMKYNTSTVFQNPISSDIIKIFYTDEIIPKSPLISIRAGSRGGEKSGIYPRAYNFRGLILKVLNFKWTLKQKS